MKKVACLAALFLTVFLKVDACLGQVEASGQAALTTIRSTSTLVIVPTLVRSTSGELVTGLKAGDFRLFDNGVEQEVSAEQVEGQPIAVVVLMQTGGSAPHQFQNYQTLSTMLTTMMGSSTYKVAMVTFDSRPEEIWNFPPRVDGLRYAFNNPGGGDGGAAIIDAVSRGIDLLQDQPASLRRVILLLSQPQDDGSKARVEDVVRRLGESNTTIYSVAFTPEKISLKGAPSLPGHTPTAETFHPPASLAAVLKAMRENTAAELAALSGGEHVRLRDKSDLESKLWILKNDFSSCYSLSFRPSSKEPGFHTIKVQVIKKPSRFDVASRTSYWVNEAGTGSKD